MRTRESLSALIEGRLSSPDGRSELVRLATRLILEEALGELAVELLARGLSVRDIEDAFRADDGGLLLLRTVVSELGEQLWRDYQDFATQDLSEHEIVYLFVDGIAERVRPGQRREPVMAAWGFTATGRRALLHLMAGSKVDAETVSAFAGSSTPNTRPPTPPRPPLGTAVPSPEFPAVLGLDPVDRSAGGLAHPVQPIHPLRGATPSTCTRRSTSMNSGRSSSRMPERSATTSASRSAN